MADAQLLEQALVGLGVAALVDLQRERPAAARRERHGQQEQRRARLAPGVLPLEHAERQEEVVRAGLLDDGSRAALDPAQPCEVRGLGDRREQGSPA